MNKFSLTSRDKAAMNDQFVKENAKLVINKRSTTAKKTSNAIVLQVGRSSAPSGLGNALKSEAAAAAIWTGRVAVGLVVAPTVFTLREDEGDGDEGEGEASGSLVGGSW